MRIGGIGIVALGVSLAVGCDRLEQVVDLGHKAQDETRREHERQFQVEERRASLQAERDSLTALIGGKLAVLSNRVTEAEAALRTLQADRAAFSRELGVATGADREAGGVGLERALASPGVNAIAMKYLHMDFSVLRGEYAAAIAKARECEAEYKRELRRLDQTFEGLTASDSQAGSASRRSRAIADLKREHDQLERKRVHLARVRVPEGNVYSNQRREHERELRNLESRLREIERMIDQFKKGDENGRKEAARIAARERESALNERNRAVEKLKREYREKPTVLKTVQDYNERTLNRMEQAFVKEAAAREETLRKSREGYLTLEGIRASVPKLSADGLRKLQGQVNAL